MAMVSRDTTNVFRMTVNEDKAKEGIKLISSALTETTELSTKIKSQLELIPQKNGVKDQLGENVENYIKEIGDKVDSDIAEPLEGLLNSESSILAKARKLDDADYNRRKIAAEKNKPIYTEM